MNLFNYISSIVSLVKTVLGGLFSVWLIKFVEKKGEMKQSLKEKVETLKNAKKASKSKSKIKSLDVIDVDRGLYDSRADER